MAQLRKLLCFIRGFSKIRSECLGCYKGSQGQLKRLCLRTRLNHIGSMKLKQIRNSQTSKRSDISNEQTPNTHNICLTCTGTNPQNKTSRWRILLCFLIVSHCLSGNLLALVDGENSPSDLSQQMLVQARLWPSNSIND